MCTGVHRGNRAEVPPAVVPTSHVPAAAAINYSTVRPASDNISLSTQGTDSCSDMGDDHHTNALSDDKVRSVYTACLWFRGHA